MGRVTLVAGGLRTYSIVCGWGLNRSLVYGERIMRFEFEGLDGIPKFLLDMVEHAYMSWDKDKEERLKKLNAIEIPTQSRDYKKLK